MDTHAVSAPAQDTALEVLAANGVETIIQEGGGFTPTPVISRAILAYNKGRESSLADGIVIIAVAQPGRRMAGSGANPPNGGPGLDVDITQWVQDRANALRGAAATGDVKRIPLERAVRRAEQVHGQDLVHPYVNDLVNVVDLASDQEREG